MIYLDNAATTFPKPEPVRQSVNTALRNFGANPGRSGYKMSVRTSEEIYKCRKVLQRFFNVEEPENIIFTSGCTQAVNMVLKGFLKKDDHVVISELEHNCVLRPLNRLNKTMGISYTKAKVYQQDNDKTLDSFRKSINERTRLIVCTHASNVWGIRLPIERICALAHEYGILVLVDAAQSAGVLPIDIKDSKIDFLCLAGHKGLYGPMGIGVLITDKSDLIDPLIEGGTGTNSISQEQPGFSPDKFESGTPNVSGIIGLRTGVEYVEKRGIKRIFNYEMNLIEYLYKELCKMDRVKLYTGFDKEHYAPVLSFNIDGMHSEEAAAILGKKNIALRGGLHCAPLAHIAYDTVQTGAIRVSVCMFNKISDINLMIKETRRLALNNKMSLS